MLRYRIYQKQTADASKAKWYARAVSQEMYDIDKLAKHMSAHNTPFSPGVIKGLITDMVDCIEELALDGKSVKIADLGIFSIALVSKGADSRAEFNIKKNVTGARLTCRATGAMRPYKVSQLTEIRELNEYTPEDDATDSGKTRAGGDTGSHSDGSGGHLTTDPSKTSDDPSNPDF